MHEVEHLIQADGHGGQEPLIVKRTASEGPETAPDPKRTRTSRDESPRSGCQPPVTPTKTSSQEKDTFVNEPNDDIEVRAVHNDGNREHMIILTGLKCLFQKQLPNMPKEYIARLVYDRTHLSIALVRTPLQVIGGVSIREFRNRNFAEIVFLAVSSDQQVKGYGARLMAHLKDFVRATSPVMHLLTYADNSAIGYFEKQGFTMEITLDKAVWMGYIKDYEGGTLMQCSMLPRIRYLEARRMLLKQKETAQAKVRCLSQNHIVHQSPWTNGVVTSIDPLSIPAIRATGWTPEMDELAREPRRGRHFNELRRFLYQIQEHTQAWPFLKPVDPEVAADYYNVIKEPMDLSTMEKRLEDGYYAGPEYLVADLKLIFRNCRQYNNPKTVYAKCAVKLEKYMWSLIKDTPQWVDLFEE